MIFTNHKNPTTIFTIVLTSALFGLVMSGCSGGGSGGGGGGTQQGPTNPNPNPNTNKAPVINSISATPNVVNNNGTFTLAVSASDPDGDQLNYLWTQTEGSSVTFTSTNSSQVQVTVGDWATDQQLKFEVRVFDTNTTPPVKEVTVQYQPNSTGGGGSGGGTGGGGGTTLPAMPNVSAQAGDRGDIFANYPEKQRVYLRMSIAGLTLSQINVTLNGTACEVVNKDSAIGFNVLLPANLNISGIHNLVVSVPGVYSGTKSVPISINDAGGTFVVMDRQNTLSTADMGRLGIAFVSSTGATTTITNESQGNGHYHPDGAWPLSITGRYFAYPSQHGAKAAVALIDASVNQGTSPVVDLRDVSTDNGTMLYGAVTHNGEVAVLWRNNTTGKLALSVLKRNNQQLDVLRTFSFDGTSGRPDYASSLSVGSFMETVFHKFTADTEQNWACFGNVADGKLVVVGMTDGKVYEVSVPFNPRHGLVGVNSSAKFDELVLFGNNPTTNAPQMAKVTFSEGGIAKTDPVGLGNNTSTPKTLLRPAVFYSSAGDLHVITAFNGGGDVIVRQITQSGNTLNSTPVATDTVSTGSGVRSMAFLPGVGLAVAASSTTSELRLYPYSTLTNNAQFTAPRVVTDSAASHSLIPAHFNFVWEVRTNPGTDSLLIYNKGEFTAPGTTPTSVANFAFDAPVTNNNRGVAAATTVPNFSR